MHNIAIFASGGGSNAEKIMAHFEQHQAISVRLLVCNKADAGVLNVAAQYDIPFLIVSKTYFSEGEDLVDILAEYEVDALVLAGFLWLIPAYLIQAFPNKILNIHPALLPKYGGKGMHGSHVHEAVKAANETQSGITIHEVNERYDEGKTIFQAVCALDADDTPNDIARKVLALEHKHFAPVIEEWLF